MSEILSANADFLWEFDSSIDAIEYFTYLIFGDNNKGSRGNGKEKIRGTQDRQKREKTIWRPPPPPKKQPTPNGPGK